MFKIDKVGEPGWLNTPVTLLATTTMAFSETRLKPHGLHVARVEKWVLEIEAGERFEVGLPNGVKPVAGDMLQLEAVMRDRSLGSKWRRLSSF